MIPKVLLLSFLSLQGGFSNRKAQSSEGEQGLNTVGTTIELDVPEVPIHVLSSGSSGQEVFIQKGAKGAKEINFNKIEPGEWRASQLSFPDNFELVQSPLHIYSLKKSFHQIYPPENLSRAWGRKQDNAHSAKFAFKFTEGDSFKFATNVTIEFGLAHKGHLTAGSYNSTILYRGGHGYYPIAGPAGSFDGSDWATTVTDTNSYIVRYEFEFTSHKPFDYLLVSRVNYDGPIPT